MVSRIFMSSGFEDVQAWKFFQLGPSSNPLLQENSNLPASTFKLQSSLYGQALVISPLAFVSSGFYSFSLQDILTQILLMKAKIISNHFMVL